MRPSQPDPTVVTYQFDVDEDLVLMGGPVIDVTLSTTAPDTQLHARALGRRARRLGAGARHPRAPTDGCSRSAAGLQARFQLTPQGYRFPAGHKIKVEVTANDVPYFQQNNLPGVVQITTMTITLPLL